MSLFSVGLSALNSSQLGLATAGHNIDNAKTDGFHRQSIIQSPNIALRTGSGFVGQGVHVDTVRRAINQTLETQLLQVQTQSAQLDSYLAQLQPIDNALGGSGAGISVAIDNFFSAASALAASPASVPARQGLISNAQALVSQFQSLAQQFDSVRDGLDTQLDESVSLINTYGAQIAELNKQIALQSAAALPGQVPNDLLDQREELISKLNKEVGTSTIIQSDGSATVFFGSGQPLVIEDQVFTLSSAPSTSDPQHQEVSYRIGTTNTLIGSNNISGGRLGGLLAFRDQILNDAQNALGRVALGFAQSFNDQHALGQDLAGNAGGNFFSIPAGVVKPYTTNVGAAVVTTTLTNAQYLTTSDYRLTKDTVGANYTLVRLSDNTQTTGITFAQLNSASGFNVDGISIKINAAATAGDSYLIQPTRDIAANIKVASGIDTTTIAAAAPIRTSATLSNLGTGKISAGAVNSPNDKVTITFNGVGYDVLDVTTGATLATNQAPGAFSFNGFSTVISGVGTVGDVFTVENGAARKTAAGPLSTSAISNPTISVSVNPNLKDTVTFTYNAATGKFAVFDVTTATALATVPPGAATYNPATGLSVSFNGFSVTLTGSPQNGDVFTVSSNVNGTSDNRNALLLNSLQSKSTLGGGTVSFEGAYSQLVSLVGNKTNEIQVTSESQAALVQQTQTAQQSVSGVNLDEEAANLLRYQQAYQAAGKVIEIASTLFDTILAIGR